MKSYRTLRRWLAAGISLAVLGVVVAWVAHRSGPIETAQKARADEIQAKISHAWALFGGSASRNMVNTLDKNIPFECNVDKGQEKNIKWSAQAWAPSHTVGRSLPAARSMQARITKPRATRKSRATRAF